MNTNEARQVLESNEAANGYVSCADLPFDRKSGLSKLGTDAWGIYFRPEGFAGLFITFTDGSGSLWCSADEFTSWSAALVTASQYGY